MINSQITITNERVKSLLALAKRGIEQHYDSSKRMFDHILTSEGPIQEHSDLLFTHSLITLLGVSCYKDEVTIDYNASVRRLLDAVMLQKGLIREPALLLWLLARDNDQRARRPFRYLVNSNPKVIAQSETMELAWLVTGLAFEYERANDADVKTHLKRMTRLLLQRFNKQTSLFMHRLRRDAWWDLRYNIANFADQIYSIYALSTVCKLIPDADVLNVAEMCADKISSVQGTQGQWWWHYNALKGSVAEKFPVYSVHQDSMAPFGLMALNEVSSKDYSSNISLGLDWIFEANELNYSMVNESKSFICRGIKRNDMLAKVRKITTLTSNYGLSSKLSRKYDKPEYLNVMEWEHSYHLGWILYAFNRKNEHLWHQL